MPYIEPRKLSEDEAAVLNSVIRRAKVALVEENWGEVIANSKVHSICGCGCASVGFVPESESSEKEIFLLADGMAVRSGASDEWVGVLVYANKSGKLVEMELHSPFDGPALLPDPNAIQEWPSN